MVYHPSYSDDTSHRGIYIDPGDEPLETRIRLVGFTDSPEERTLRVNNESNMSYTTIVEETSPGTFSELPLDEGFVRRGGVHEEPHPAVGIALSIEESRQTIMAVSTGQAALSRLYYTLTLSMSRESDTLPTPPSKQRKVPFCLRVDTGCNNSWVFDRKVCELRGTPNEPDAVSTLPTIKVAPGCWPSGRPALWKHSAQILATRLPVERDGDVVWTCTAERPYPIVRYGENSVVVLGLMQHPGREVLVQDCTSFNVEHNIAWERELKFPLRLGVVYAASPNILRDLRKHGFAGLGRSMCSLSIVARGAIRLTSDCRRLLGLRSLSVTATAFPPPRLLLGL
ncbi:hypothetical protein L227DRAFT_580614 [Lentinus tigrinus ALCF2SS1-6]|uniref:Uncharacterized protein n=1 Tax=Lentinus tigrinus ALCF2SS1-6 TaxID=1328759 RepID=A0A5C2RUK6_9APHY|nr:hypothetical protein L227DRAFT_580614 [Lentinus tigrinus ALCF2SS1-6]